MSWEGVQSYCDEVRCLVLEEIDRHIPRRSDVVSVHYGPMLEQTRREGKLLRPAICIATCRALAGGIEPVIGSAAALELFHNAFLIHDDIEDGSHYRRRTPALYREHGVPVAINIGDGLLALAMRPLLDNTRRIGLGRSLRILSVIARMSQESAEGQALELAWPLDAADRFSDSTYSRIVHKKSSWYSFVAPVMIGAITAGRTAGFLDLCRYARLLGVAFQTQDDILNIVGEEERYGKEICGDLWEGKITLILAHAIRTASPRDRAKALALLSKQRPRAAETSSALAELLTALVEAGEISRSIGEAIEQAAAKRPSDCRTQSDVEFLLELVRRRSSIDYALVFARSRARRAAEALERAMRDIPNSSHIEFLRALALYVLDRES